VESHAYKPACIVKRSSRTAEGGVIIPIVAVMSLAIIATLSILGLETTRMKQSATVLRGETERICKNVARSATIPADAVALFSREINLLPKIDPFTRITGAKLTLPLPLDASGLSNGLNGVFYDFSDTQKTTCNTAAKAFDLPPTDSPSLPFKEIDSSLRCYNTTAAPTLNDCVFAHDICDRSQTPPLADPNYPPSMWSDIQNAANTVGCEITAEVDRVLSFGAPSTTRQVSAKAAWWIPVRARAPYLSDFGLSTTSPSSFPGLSLGIATQMTTWPGDPTTAGGTVVGDNRFNFSAYSPTFASWNPRRTPQAGENPQRLNLTPTNFQLTMALSYPSSSYGIGSIQVPPSPSVLLDSAPSRASDEYLTACVNPLVMIRNMITSSIVELAARHGQLRNLTQVTSINPRHKGDSAWANAMNRPVEIVRFGEDLTNESYQHPFVTAYIDETVQGLGTSPSGFLLPWQLTDGTPRYYYPPNAQENPQRLKRDTFLAQQLRYCFHLWDSDLVPRPGLPLHRSLSLLPMEFGFLASLQNPPSSNPNDPTFYRTWDYGLPWGGSNTSGVSRLLNGAEVVQSLGSTQLCPVSQDPGGVFNCKMTQFNPTNDLEPDLKAFLDHQLGNLSAYPSPGLFHPTNASNGEISLVTELNPSSPMYRASNTVPVPPRSVVVIVTTKGLFDAAGSTYHTDIVSRVQSLNAVGRPVVIVFIPATGADSNTAPNYCAALRRGPDCSSPGLNADSNRLFLLSPYSMEYGGTYNGATEGETFIKFWQDLLTESSVTQDLFAPRIGQAIFSEAIVGLGPKL